MNHTSAHALRWLPLAVLAAAIAFMGSIALEWWKPWWGCRGLSVLVGLVALTGTLFRPSWFWNSRRARRGRALLGDGAYSGLMLGIGLLLVYVGLMSRMLDRCNME